jgi:hypothetical protein
MTEHQRFASTNDYIDKGSAERPGNGRSELRGD